MVRSLPGFLLAALAVCSIAYAATPAAVVSPSDLATTKVTYKLGTKTKQKLIYCRSKVAGDAKSVPGGLLFTPFATTLAQLKAKKVGGVKVATYTQLNSAGKKSCSKLATTEPTPTPTPPASSLKNFDASGNVTEFGRATFGIPSSLSGNISSGRSLNVSYCSCHGEKLGRSFTYTRSAIAQSPMFFDSTQIPDSALANIIAYLNRFNS